MEIVLILDRPILPPALTQVPALLPEMIQVQERVRITVLLQILRQLRKLQA
ncbi:hypothetical protein LEP1GSC059_1483 [Leptospira noguchii serovar Panama str. CZ214]|uniref:Uncharacterized protein n=1 Tax=Leptospira noguchii serovar Panama str. CZ214 TaxID=1001595 RepID=T0GVU4_9LEPT|nr:hypothetical protein LEP1GSC059_1483 [Leptospira noguchii serovar Panama str. CZ214]